MEAIVKAESRKQKAEIAATSTSAFCLLPSALPLELSIIVVTWNSERWIERCLSAIGPACGGLTYEIIVHDNASTDSTLARVDESVAQVLRSASNIGFASATNRSLAASRGRFVFLLNPDCELAPGSLSRLVDYLEKHPDVAAVAPLLDDDGGGSQREFQLRRLPTLNALVCEALLIDKILPGNRATARYRYRDLDVSTPRRVEQPAAAALLIRRDVFDQIGPFDEQFAPAWFEDVDFCQRLARSGMPVVVVPDARARHAGGASLEHIPYAEFIDHWYRNMLRYARKWMSPGQAEALRWFIITGMLLRCSAAILGFGKAGGSRLSAFRAYASVLRNAFHRWDE
jgi:GT2 family glycosyltransferase